jgi:HEAT repeat protein
MSGRLLVAILLTCPGIASGQVTGHFFLQKETFAPGEPVFLYFEATNSGTETQNLHQADPYSFCSGYEIRVSSDPTSSSSCAAMFTGGSCLSSDAPLGPGKSRTERILLNYEHKVDAPGYYEVEAVRHSSYAAADLEYFTAAKTPLEVREHLHFRVDENAATDNLSIQSLVEQLHSPEESARREAARALASLAPKSLEDLLLSFAKSGEFKEWAPLAFHRLNTPRSLEALGELLRTTEPGTYENMKSAEFLAQTGDQKWFPLLLEIAQKNAKNGSYVFDAAESGGELILPTLLMMMRSSDAEFARPIAISAFAYSGSRAVIPILLNLLRSTDSGTSERALFGLRQLTHRSAMAGDRWFDDPQSQYAKWAQWWNRNGANAPVYKTTECGEVTPLE